MLQAAGLGVLEDRRLGGFVRYYLASPGEPEMLIPDAIRKCVIFIYANFGNGLRPVGTAFLLATPVRGQEAWWVDLVTAKHVLHAIRDRSLDEKVVLRFNLKDGTHRFIETSLDRWQLHPDDTVDVAVTPCVVVNEFDVNYVPDEIAATKAVVDKYRIGIGDEVFITGLFSSHIGQNKNIPILRVGNIAATPEEPVSTEMGKMEAYLIEARSIGGLSGSPVFVYLDPIRHGGPPGTHLRGSGGPMGGMFFLLGLVHGHYDVPPAADTSSTDGLSEEKINMGIAIVTPVSKILETINQEERIAVRKKHEEKIAKEKLPTPDALLPSQFERMTELTRRVVSVPKSEIKSRRKKRKRP